MANHNFHIYERDGVFQASLYKMRRFAQEGENILVGVGCDEEEAVEELKAKLEAR